MDDESDSYVSGKLVTASVTESQGQGFPGNTINIPATRVARNNNGLASNELT